MPNNDTVFSPSNCWAFIETGICTHCEKPRYLYANSMVREFIGCGSCLISKMADQVRMIKELSEVNPYWAVRYATENAEYEFMSIQRGVATRLVYSDDACASCWQPFSDEITEGMWRKVEAYDGDDKPALAHANCSMSCDDCDKSFPRWSSASSGVLVVMDMNRYLGVMRCTSCVSAITQEYGENAFFYCEECNSYEYRENARDFGSDTICSHCYNDNVTQCDDCDELYWHNNDHDCDENISNNLIHDYSYRPRPHFFGQAKYHFGFELEVESEGNSRKAGASYVVDRLSPRVYLKNDGSLDEGFEIVSHPHSLEELQKKFNWEVLDGLKKQGFRSWHTNTCGLHVHVSRTAFGEVNKRSDILKAQSHELRFIKLIYDNQRQIERLAGRSSSYAKFNDKGKLANRVKYGQQDDRYEAVNSQNTSTLEVRVFRGSLKPARVLSAIELVHASVEYTRDLKVNANNNALKWIHFVRFVADQAETYPNLVNAIQNTFDNDLPADEIN